MLKLDHVCNSYFCTNIDWDRPNFTTFIGCMVSSFWCLIWPHRCRQQMLSSYFFSKIWWRILVVRPFLFQLSLQYKIQPKSYLDFSRLPHLFKQLAKVKWKKFLSRYRLLTNKADEILKLWNYGQNYEQVQLLVFLPICFALGLISVISWNIWYIHHENNTLNKNHNQKSNTTTITILFSRCTALGVSSPPLPFPLQGPFCCTSSAMLSLMRCCFLDYKIMLIINPLLSTYW